MDKLKKKLFAVIMISIITISGAGSVFAASPSPTASAKTVTTETKNEEKPSDASSTEQKNTVTATQPVNNDSTVQKKYTTRGGSFGWFLLSIIINAILSFAIGNRFYKMSKKDTRINAEIRALRRDIEDKFVNNIGGFSESEVDIANNNDDYSTDKEGIKANVESSEKNEESAEEIFKKWESQMAAQRAAKRASIRASVTPKKDEPEEDKDDTHNRFEHSQSYQPRRAIKNETVKGTDEDIDEDIESDADEDNKSGSITSKAKHIITEIFPFKDE